MPSELISTSRWDRISCGYLVLTFGKPLQILCKNWADKSRLEDKNPKIIIICSYMVYKSGKQIFIVELSSWIGRVSCRITKHSKF